MPPPGHVGIRDGTFMPHNLCQFTESAALLTTRLFGIQYLPDNQFSMFDIFARQLSYRGRLAATS